ncbi:DEAD/DEAH box helicase [Streptomyces mutabilis]|uniref:DEAD/DEAH box helicase n=1 Tax=Streptomyces mutabilis TaxID=67332 RepID=UPI0006950BD5|nr:DEAD/DEAH box helicase [Streptomyces mutabilis]
MTPEDHEVGALDAGQWHEALKQLAGSDTDDTAMARDALRRNRAGLLTVRDMRLVLLVTPDTPAWVLARQSVMDYLVHNPETARQVLATHTQVEVWPPPRFEETDTALDGGQAQVTVAAVIGPAESQVTGPAQSAHTSRDAKDRAALALLARLAGVTLPGQDPAALGEAERPVLPGMPSEVFEQRLRRDVEAGRGPGAEMEIEALKRARAGRLRHRELYLLLLEARSPAWAAVREAALQRAAAMPPAPARLLHWHAEQHGADRGLTYTEDVDAHGLHHTRAQLTVGEGTSAGPVRSAPVRKTARHYAACALLALMADLPEPAYPADEKPAATPKITIPGPDQDPVKHLNKHYQLDTITRPEANVRTLGARREVTYSCRHRASDTPVRATAAGPDKTSARRAAALKLLRKLHALDTAPAHTPAPAVAGSGERRAVRSATASTPSSPAPAPRTPAAQQRAVLNVGNRPAAALLLDAVTCGCAVTFMPADAGRSAAWRVQDNGQLALPMTGLPDPLTAESRSDGPAGWSVPLLEGLPILRHAHRGASATAGFWQRALHIALQLIAAQLVHPAHDDGRAEWRVGPIPPNAEHALSVLAAAAPAGAAPPAMPARQALTAAADAIADALIRTPAAALFGTGPWTHPDQTTVAADGEVGVWLDRVEDRVDGGPAPQVILRIEEPSDERAATGRLTAELHLAPAAPDATPIEAAVPAVRLWSGAARLAGQQPDALRLRVRRVLRRAARRCAALAGLAAQDYPARCTLYPAAVEALLEQEAELAEHGVRVVWPEALRTALQAAAVIGTEPATGTAGHRPAGEAPRFSVTALLDFRWQVALDGVPLSEEEMDALAEAARPLVRVRGRWVLADAVLRQRARHRLLGHLPGTQALTAALTGTITVDDNVVPCRTAGHLARMVGVLTGGEHHPELVPAPTGLRATLRGYQQRALTWLAHTTRLGFGAVLADDMGLGKTLTALAFTLHHQRHTPGPTLVICPASLVTTWCREAARFTPGLNVHAYHGTSRTLNEVTDTTVVVTTYGVLRRDTARLAGRTWSLVIADEAQHAKNPVSATARQLRALPSTTRLALTGTPVENNLSELWALLDWTNPGLFGTLKAYRSRWANAVEKNPGGEQALELGRVITPFLLRRRKTDPGIAPELPAKIDQPRLVRLTTEQAGLYEAVVRETLEQIQASCGITRNGLVFKLLTALKKIANHPAHYLREDPATAADAPEFTARSAKAAALIDLLEAIRARSEASLLFTSYVSMGHLLHRHLDRLGYEPLFLHGATTLPERQRMVDAFQTGRHPVMILSLKAAGTGLTLTRAAHVIHYDRSWNAAVEDQATDRAHRIGQHKTVTVHRLITEHTVEDRIDELLTHKRTLASAVLTSGDRALTQLTDRELAAFVTLGASR